MAGKQSQSEVETELKIKLSAADLEKVFKKLTSAKPLRAVQHKFLPRSYYDTSKLDFHHANLSLRVQYKQGTAGKLGGYEQTVKLEQPVTLDRLQDVHYRRECKNTLPAHIPDLSRLSDLAAIQAFAPFKNKTLIHIFTAAIERRYFNLPVSHGKTKGLVEIAFDVGLIILPKPNKSQSFFEIEIELKRGNPLLIDVVKKRILRLAPSAKIQTLSKAAQGTAFYLKHPAINP